jgi:hypothetical protein
MEPLDELWSMLGAGRTDTVKEGNKERAEKFQAMENLFGRKGEHQRNILDDSRAADTLVEPFSMDDEGYFNEEGQFVKGQVPCRSG